MDGAAQIRAIFDTSVNGATAVAAKSQWLTVSNSKLTVGAKTFNSSPTSPAQATITAANLFPFLDGYGVFAGACSSNNPALAPTNNSALLQTFSPTPGQVLTMTTANDIRMPSINVRVVTNADVLVSASPFATVIVKTNDSGCTNRPSRTRRATPPAPCRSPGSPTAATRSALSARWPESASTGAPTSTTAAYDALNNGTGAPVAETISNKVDDTVFNTTAAGNPTNTDHQRRHPDQAEPDGCVHVTPPPPSLRRARLHASSSCSWPWSSG